MGRSRQEAQSGPAAAVQRGPALHVLLALPAESGWKTINYEPELARSLHRQRRWRGRYPSPRRWVGFALAATRAVGGTGDFANTLGFGVVFAFLSFFFLTFADNQYL